MLYEVITGADLILLEMLEDDRHAAWACEEACASGLPVWVGISATQRPDGTLVGWDSDAENAWQTSETSPWPDPPPFDELVDRLVNLGGQVAGIMHTSNAIV